MTPMTEERLQAIERRAGTVHPSARTFGLFSADDVTAMIAEIRRLREALTELCDQVEASEEHGAGATEEFCPVCQALEAARAALSQDKEPS